LGNAGIYADRNVTANYNTPNIIDLDADGKLYFGNAFDTNLYRSAADRLSTDDLLIATLGVQTKTKAGTPVDADWATPPPNGTIVIDTTASKIWVRIGGVWKGAVLT